MRKQASANHYLLLAAGAIAALAACWFAFLGEVPMPASPPQQTPPPPREMSQPASQSDALDPQKAPSGPLPLSLPSTPPETPIVPAVTVRDVEASFASATDAEARAEAARNLASMDTPESMQALARLFATPRPYTDRVAIISALSESQADETLETKITLLRAALAPGQVRQVPSAALDVASQMDDPRAVALVRNAAKNESDPQLREFARTVLGES